ncbi:MAG: 16S rRNA (cytosine(1402)-N(4))-methyltransferase RsmH [Ignavibacteriales bacterium]|nr:MAG: 16S rRNA (cytosine(1402)-N(4))-methyltransferase RsmH [Ignavibacteriales bacterium]
MNEIHVPVLLRESTELLITNKNGIYFDSTLGFGGHSSHFLNILSKDAGLVATEVDDEAYSYCKNLFQNDPRVKLNKANFSKIDVISKIEFIDGYDGIFADLGVSSYQFDESRAGFSYRQESALDLRLDKSIAITAADIINSYSEEDLANIFFEYGEENNSRHIARAIVKQRENKKIDTTVQLAKIIEEHSPAYLVNKVLSRIFQALRIYINDELSVLKEFLEKAVTLLKKNANIVVISYHSLEDRIVKEFFRYKSLKCVCPAEFPVCVCGKIQRLNILTKKPITPSEEELKLNRRARSAKLRAAKKI